MPDSIGRRAASGLAAALDRLPDPRGGVDPVEPLELLREKGQIFVGIDVIGDWLTEINVTSPTGLQELERFDGINATARIWEAIERRRAA